LCSDQVLKDGKIISSKMRWLTLLWCVSHAVIQSSARGELPHSSIHRPCAKQQSRSGQHCLPDPTFRGHNARVNGGCHDLGHTSQSLRHTHSLHYNLHITYVTSRLFASFPVGTPQDGLTTCNTGRLDQWRGLGS